jgi:hypothetical protein
MRSFMALYEVPGQELWVRELDQQLQFGVGRLISADLALANVQAPEPMPYGQLPAFVDLQAGVIHPVGGPFGQPPLQGRNSFAGFIKAAVAKVAGAGDCLNVRETASTAAPVLGCFVDGVLLRDLGETAEADGVTWLKVATPDGRKGWASTEFLER